MAMPGISLMLPRKYSSGLLTFNGDGIDGGGTEILDVSDSSYPHWEAWIEFYSDTAGTTLVLPNSGVVSVTVSPVASSKTGYALYAESITNGTINPATPVRANWSGRAGTILFNPDTDVTAGSAVRYQFFAWGYFS